MTRARLAAQSGVDRSTLTQLLAEDTARLPRADTVAAIATTLQISVDWLLGLTADVRRSADIVRRSLEFAPASQTAVDASLDGWFEEAAGYKIRYVPSTLPDLVKTERILRHEYADDETRTADQAIVVSRDRLRYSRSPETDIEVCMSRQALSLFAQGQGIWTGLEDDSRYAQLSYMIELVEELYPRFRLYLFDELNYYSIPYTVFGPLRVALYVGQMFLCFNTKEHVRILTQHFDTLIRGASVQAHDTAAWLTRLRDGELNP